MAIDNVQAVLSKQIGTNKCDIVTKQNVQLQVIITAVIFQ
jgi:hypothetical protein